MIGRTSQIGVLRTFSAGGDTIVRAVKSLPKDIDLELAIHAVEAGQSEREYRRRVQVLAENDTRVKISPPIARKDLWPRMGEFDALLVPSRCQETGPLVVLEALARGLFIVGSNLGGIAEWVEPGSGLLVPAGDVGAWARAILWCHKEKRAGRFLRRPPRPLRSMRDVAKEMYDLYGELL